LAEEFKHLFTPLQIGTTTVRNRILSTAHLTGIGSRGAGGMGGGGILPDALIAYWASKAKGGIGLIVTQVHPIHHSAGGDVFSFPGAVVAFRKAADGVHEHGAKLVAQLWHPGNQGGSAMRNPWAPSVVPALEGWYPPHEMTVEEIKEVIAGYAHGAAVVREAGLDGAEIHGAHGYLITQFLSPLTNRRTDEYGGSLEKRTRFACEIIDAVRTAVGPDFTVGMRISGDEFIEGGYTLDDMLKMVPLFTKDHKLDYLSVSAGTYRSAPTIIAPMYYPLGFNVYLAAAVKAIVDIPIFCIGRINDPVVAEEILANNQADMIGMTRANICDPELPNKAREGRLEDIRKCMGCNEGCWGRLDSGQSVTCAINPVVGRELEPGWLELIPAGKQKKVMVIGGGPGGCEAARVAAARGHSVSLYDKASELGGLVNVARLAPGQEGFQDIARWHSYQLKQLNVDMHLNTEVTADMVKAQNPDTVVVATGSLPLIPDFPGVDQDNVVEARDMLNGKVNVGERVIVLAGNHHMQPLSVADFLASRGKKVEIVTEEYHAGSHVEMITRMAIYARLYQNGVVFTPCNVVRSISGNTVTLANVFSGEERQAEADTLVLACGGREDNSLYYQLRGQVPELYRIGDCNGVRRILDAVLEGAVVGRRL